MSSSKLRRKERDWKPKMKERGRKATVSDSGSSQAAHMAMANIKDIGRRRDRGQEVDEAYLAKVSKSIDPAAALKQQTAGANSGRRTPRWAVAAGVMGVACVLLMLLPAAFHKTRHSVSGRVLLDRQPLGNVQVRFHPAEPGASAANVTTSPRGTFEISDLPTGSYKVTLHADEGGPAIPPAYTEPTSTLFKLNLERDLSNISLYAVQPKRR